MKTILVTGATDGIGLETAKALAAKGHKLLIHGRSAEKINKTVKLLEGLETRSIIESYQADLSDFDDTRQLIADVRADHSSLDIIINNAGVFKTNAPLTNTGMDVRFCVNTFSPYMLTKGLMSLLAENGRVINLSSAAQAPVNLKALRGEVNTNDAFQAYAQSKLAMTIWSQELARELSPKQVIVAVNPGSLLASKMVKEGFGMAGNDIAIGADILVRAALSEDFSDANGKYFDNDIKQFILPHSDAQNQQLCDQIMAVMGEVANV